MNIEDIEYVVLAKDSSDHSERARELYNRAYQFWEGFWSKFWERSHQASAKPASNLSEVFYRQTRVHALMYENEFVAMLLQTRYDLRVNFLSKLNYFSFYSPEIFEELRARSIEVLVTHEFLAVDPVWRRASVGIPLAPSLVACASQEMDEVGAQACLGIARKDVGVHKLCASLGWSTVQENFSYNGFDCDVVCLESPDRLVIPEPLVAPVTSLMGRRQVLVPGALSAPLAEVLPMKKRAA